MDIGSVSLNTVLLDENYNVIEDYYDYVHGRPFNVLKDRLSSILKTILQKILKELPLPVQVANWQLDLLAESLSMKSSHRPPHQEDYFLMHRQ